MVIGIDRMPAPSLTQHLGQAGRVEERVAE
jgi:hypothetical protein